jgi:hypothetical protein
MSKEEEKAENAKEVIRRNLKSFAWFKGVGVKWDNLDYVVVVNSSKITDIIPDSINGVKIKINYVE